MAGGEEERVRSVAAAGERTATRTPPLRTGRVNRVLLVRAKKCWTIRTTQHKMICMNSLAAVVRSKCAEWEAELFAVCG